MYSVPRDMIPEPLVLAKFLVLQRVDSCRTKVAVVVRVMHVMPSHGSIVHRAGKPSTLALHCMVIAIISFM